MIPRSARAPRSAARQNSGSGKERVRAAELRPDTERSLDISLTVAALRRQESNDQHKRRDKCSVVLLCRPLWKPLSEGRPCASRQVASPTVPLVKNAHCASTARTTCTDQRRSSSTRYSSVCLSFIIPGDHLAYPRANPKSSQATTTKATKLAKI